MSDANVAFAQNGKPECEYLEVAGDNYSSIDTIAGTPTALLS